MVKIIPVILCGGSGTRLWPVSRSAFPKQFVAIDAKDSTFQQTVARVSDASLFEAPIVITSTEHRFLVKRQLSAFGGDSAIILEPEPRDSGPAMVAGALYAEKYLDPNAILLFLAADHEIDDAVAFRETCSRGVAAASKGYIVTFGIPAAAPETRYGYIRPGKAIDDNTRIVEEFIEKPDAETAAVYRNDGYLWNSGNFLVQAKTLVEEYNKRAPDTVAAVGEAMDKASRDLGFVRLDAASFAKAEKRSIDYAVMEHTEKAAVVSATFGWSDLGTWDAYWQVKPHDDHGNAFLSSTEAVDSKNCFTFSEDALIALVGVQNLAVIATRDAILVANRDDAGRVKDLVGQMKRAKRPQTDNHLKCYRPWGWYQTLELGPRFQVKRIVVYPGERLSLQKHFHRAEHWVVVRGTALVTNGDTEKQLHENESTFIPMGNVHRLENPGKIDLELIEVQSGSYLGEDDIVRLEDTYARV